MQLRVNFYTFETMCIAKQFNWRKKLEEYNKSPNYTYFEKKYDQISTLDV